MAIDLKFYPEADDLYRAIPQIKEQLQLNIELAAPSDFIPELPDWQNRCEFITREGSVSFYNYDPYSQALSKIERGHDQDVADVTSMFRDGLLTHEKLLSLFNEIKPHLYKYPAIDPKTFSDAVDQVVRSEIDH